MKKSYLVLVISVLVLATTFLWFISTGTHLSFADIMQFGIVLAVVGLAVFVGISRLKSEKRGEPAEDEFSKRILQKASSLSYYISLYLWLAIMYFSDKTKLENHTLIGTGILGMAVIFCLCWAYFKIWGTKHV
jgi:peptidoglycan/LPS O-acetylase OafA/YrhL